MTTLANSQTEMHTHLATLEFLQCGDASTCKDETTTTRSKVGSAGNSGHNCGHATHLHNDEVTVHAYAG